MQNKIKIVSWNATGADQGSISSLLSYSQTQDADAIFLQNVDVNVVAGLKSQGIYALLSIMYVNATKRGQETYVVYYNTTTLQASDRGKLPVPGKPANADQFQEARITTNAYSQVQLVTKSDPTQNPEAEIAQANYQYAEANASVAQSNQDFAKAIEDAMIAILAANGNPTSTQQNNIENAVSLATANYKYTQSKMAETAQAKEARSKLGTSTANDNLEVEKENAANDGGSNGQAKTDYSSLQTELTAISTDLTGKKYTDAQTKIAALDSSKYTGSVKTALDALISKGKPVNANNAKDVTKAVTAVNTAITNTSNGGGGTQASGNQGLFQSLDAQYKVLMNYKETPLKDQNLEDTSVLRPKAKKNTLTTQNTLTKASQAETNHPFPKQHQVAIFNWSAPRNPNTPDGDNYGLYAFQRSVDFFEHPNGSLPPGSGLVALGDFNMTTNQMKDSRGQAFRNVVTADGGFGESTNHMVNFNQGVGTLIKDSSFQATNVYGGDSFPYCAYYQF